MTTCDVLIVGGGPAGSTCARKLVRAGLNVVIVDKATFPRDKVCAGWITPQVLESLQFDVASYSQGRVFQAIDGFHVGLFGQTGIDVSFNRPVSYAIRRCEFDDYLLSQSGAKLLLGTPIRAIEKSSIGWRVNEDIEARMLIGAGGHFCPVARRLRSTHLDRPQLVTAIETEFPMARQHEAPGLAASMPRLYFRDDLSGYGWCFRKDDYLNMGVGLVDSRETASEIARLTEMLRRDQAFAGEIPGRAHGHAYYLYDGCRSQLVDEAVLLIGDAAGLADPQSGEGIRPAIESGLIAAQVIVEALGNYRLASLLPYQAKLRARLGDARSPWVSQLVEWLGQGMKQTIVRRLMRSQRFVRDTVIGAGFLHNQSPALVM